MQATFCTVDKVPGMLEAARLLAPGGLHVKATLGSVVRAPRRPTLLLARLPVDRLAIAPVLRAMTVEDVNHVVQLVPRAKSGWEITR